MAFMFANCSSLTSLDVSGFDTGNVTDMTLMFANCSSLTSLDVSGFNTSNVTDMRFMFADCSDVTSLDVSGFDTGNVTNMHCMFSGCISLTRLDLSSFNLSNVTNVSDMLSSCHSLTSLNAPGQADTERISIDLPGTFADSEGNRTNVLDRNYIGKLLTKYDDAPNATYSISGALKIFNAPDISVTVELINDQGEVTASQSVAGGTTEYHLENVPVGNYTLRLSQEGRVLREYLIAVTDTNVSQNAEEQRLGDVNGDGTVNARDKKMLFNHIEKISVLSGYLFDVGDVNGDGTINARDKKLLYNHIERIAPLWEK